MCAFNQVNGVYACENPILNNLLKGQAPEAAHMVFRVKKRETLHTLWYRDMTAIQIEANPHLVEDVATEILSFDMPGASLVR